MPYDPWVQYGLMLKSRLFEEAAAKLWHDGLISGEMHLGTGEEAIIAGVVSHLREGDAMALDHRGSAALLMRGVDSVLILRELLGRPDGLCKGMGGHMHLFSRGHLAASSGIVGAGGPAAVGFALAGSRLRPVVELYMIDFLGVAADALLNQAAKIEAFSGGDWTVPLVVRAPCGGGYGDGGQHEQSLWGWLAHIPGLTIIVPSTPADAGGLMTAALQKDGPTVFCEPKLLSESWLDLLGSGGRTTVHYDVPEEGARGPVPRKWEPIPIGRTVLRRAGGDLSLVSAGVGVHRALQAAETLQKEGISADVLDLRTISPLDTASLRETASKTGRLLVVDEDYEGFGLSGEIAALLAEAGLSIKYGRVCTRATIPYARPLEDRVLPNVERICAAARKLV